MSMPPTIITITSRWNPKAPQPGAPTCHLGDVPALAVSVGLAQTRRQPGPRAQPPRVVEAADITDLGDEHGGQDGTDAAQRLDRLVAGMTLQPAVDARIALADLAVIQLDQVAQRLDPIDVHVAEAQLVQPSLAAGPPDAVQLGDHPLLAEGLMDLL